MMKRSFADIMQDLDGDRARKVARKLPEWAAADAARRAAGLDPLEFPSALSLEQCSSSATALYKAHLAGQAVAAAKLCASRYPSQPNGWAPPVHDATGGTVLRATLPAPAEHGYDRLSDAKAPIRLILDLTGGLGVDSWAFSKVAERVVYYERDAALAEAAGRNFARLGAGNIELRCETVSPETDLPEADLIYADPARRDAAGRKVFLLEDCTPDILTLLTLLLQKSPAVLLKLSPMADLTMLADRLGPALREIHVVELDGEVKELLCLLRRDPATAALEIVVSSLRSPSPETPAPDAATMRFRPFEERAAAVSYAVGLQPGDTLLEPCPALLKAGAFRLPCERWGLRKLAHSTHLYLFPDPPGAETAPCAPGSAVFPSPGAETPPGAPSSAAFPSPGAETPPGAPEDCDVPPFFKAWRIRDVLPFGAKAFKDLRKRFPRAEITAHNLPLGSEALRKKLGIAPGGDAHLFGCRLADGSSVLLVTEPLSRAGR